MKNNFFGLVFLFLIFALAPVSSVFAASPGALINAFDLGSSQINGISVNSDGDIYLTGYSTFYDSGDRIVRLNSDGTVDSGFDPGTGFNNDVRTHRLLSDGKIIAAGNFTTYNGTAASRVVRLDTDGSIDNTFDYGAGFNATTYTVEVDADGKYLYVGNFGQYNGVSTMTRLTRLNTDGSRDATLDNASGIGTYPFAIETQDDGKIIVGGTFGTALGTSTARVIRMTSTGSVDEDFQNNLGTGFNNTPWNIKELTNGKLLFAGNFTEFNGTTVGYLVLLNADGTLNTEFQTNVGTGLNDAVGFLDRVWELSDGRILLGSSFTEFNGETFPSLVMLNQDGTVNEDFDPSLALNGAQNIRSMYVDTDEETLYLAGSFTTVSEGAVSGVVTLTLVETVDEVPSSGGVSPILQTPTTPTLSGEVVNDTRLRIQLSYNPNQTTTDSVGFTLSETDGKTSTTTVSDSYSLWNGSFSHSQTILGLSCDTTYTLRAYAKNSTGVAYSEKITLTTLDCVQRATSGGDRNSSDDEEITNSDDTKTEEDTTTEPVVLLGNTFQRNLSLGDTGVDVRVLQETLNMLGFTVATDGPGSPGQETEYYGILTQKSVLQLQQTFNITPATGVLGLRARELLNLIVALKSLGIF